MHLFSTLLHSKDRNFFHEEKDAPRRSRVKIGSQSGNSSWPGYKSLSRKAPRARRKLEHKEYWPTYRDPSPPRRRANTTRFETCCATHRIGCVARPVNRERKRGGSSSSSIVESFSRIERDELRALGLRLRHRMMNRSTTLMAPLLAYWSTEVGQVTTYLSSYCYLLKIDTVFR